MEYESLFEEIHSKIRELPDTGKVATYIPELSNVDPELFGVCLATTSNQSFTYGDFNKKFSIQSIAKVPALVLAYRSVGPEIWKRVGVEPSGTAFNSLVQLEYDNGIPRNPFINAGALVISDILIDILKNPEDDFINFLREISGNPEIDYSPRIAQSEKETGFRNAALVNLMKDFGNIRNDVEEVLDFYFNLCSVEMTTTELSETFLFLANNGISPHNSKRILNASRTKRVNAIMQTCGFYDEAGEFSFKVGLPGKSGVGGGIVAILPGQYSIAVFSPKLNTKGNSYRGMQFLELFTTKTETSIF